MSEADRCNAHAAKNFSVLRNLEQQQRQTSATPTVDLDVDMDVDMDEDEDDSLISRPRPRLRRVKGLKADPAPSDATGEMTRAVHATTPSGDEITLEANAQLAARGRTVAQVEHNAMQALDLVRATLHALTELSAPLDRLTLLLSHSRGVPISTIVAELQRVLVQLGESIHSAVLREDPLLTGGSASFTVEDPHDESSAPLQIDLPDLTSAYGELAELDFSTSTHAQITAKQVHLTSLVQAAKKQLKELQQRLTGLLASQRPPRPLTPRSEDEGFVAMIQNVRESVLHAGNAALRVQGSPSSRATWLIEAFRDTL